MNDILLYLQNKYLGNWMQIYMSLQDRERITMENIQDIQNKFKDRKFITLLDDEYPYFLKNWYKPPFLVEQVGDKYYYVYGENLQEKYELYENREPYHKSLEVAGETYQEQLYTKFISQFKA